jgi:hypothetical protein
MVLSRSVNLSLFHIDLAPRNSEIDSFVQPSVNGAKNTFASVSASYGCNVDGVLVAQKRVRRTVIDTDFDRKTNGP